MLFSVTGSREVGSLSDQHPALIDVLGAHGVVVYSGNSFVIIDSVYGWDYLRELLQGYIVGELNPDSELGKEILKKGIKHHAEEKDS